MVSAAFQTEMDRKQGSQSKVKVEFIDTLGTVTDISLYYLSGANFDQIKERAADEIQAGNFDVEVSNHDDTFSEFLSTSLLFETQYHGAKIRISLGFILPDGTEEFEVQAVGVIDELQVLPDSKAVFRCRDQIQKILDGVLHARPLAEIPILAGASVGNGIISSIKTKPFATLQENWTLTCTTGGGDGAGIFSVVGSVSGALASATSGTEFSDSSAGLKFKISGGSTNWAIGDIFTFSTKKYPEWSALNPAKIIWSVLTGFDWDSDTVETFSALVLDFDSTQTSANTDINYQSFVDAIADLDDVSSLGLKGYAAYDEKAAEFIEGVVLIFLGAIFTDSDGKIKIQTGVPRFEGVVSTEFKDEDKIMELGTNRSIDEVINHVTAKYKATDSWEFSDESVILDGEFTTEDAPSITKYKKLSFNYSSRFFSSAGNFTEDTAERLVGKFADPPVNIEFETGLDALTIGIGQIIRVTDTKLNFSAQTAEVSRLEKRFDDQPKTIAVTARRDSDIDLEWGFFGSSVPEGDGISPQALNFDSATEDDKKFCYLSQTGGGVGAPDYRMF